MTKIEKAKKIVNHPLLVGRLNARELAERYSAEQLDHILSFVENDSNAEWCENCARGGRDAFECPYPQNMEFEYDYCQWYELSMDLLDQICQS